MGRGMAEEVKNYNYRAYLREELQRCIDNGKYNPSESVKRYFYECPPYKYTALEPSKNYMAQSREERTTSSLIFSEQG